MFSPQSFNYKERAVQERTNKPQPILVPRYNRHACKMKTFGRANLYPLCLLCPFSTSEFLFAQLPPASRVFVAALLFRSFRNHVWNSLVSAMAVHRDKRQVS